MNFGALSAMAMALGVLLYGLILSGDSLKIFYDFPSFFIVIGGVVAVTAMSFQYRRMFAMMKFGILRVIKGKNVNFSDVITNVILNVESYRRGESLKSITDKTEDQFFKEGLALLDGGVLTPDQVFE